MSAPHLVAGRAAEDAAASALERQGFRILLRNFRARCGELDLVAQDGATLAIIEVRYRAGGRHGGGAESVTAAKRRRIALAAQVLLVREPALARLPARFDVVEVSGPAAALECRLIRDAFRL